MGLVPPTAPVAMPKRRLAQKSTRLSVPPFYGNAFAEGVGFGIRIIALLVATAASIAWVLSIKVGGN